MCIYLQTHVPSLSVVATVVVTIIDDDVGPCGYQQFWQGFLLIAVKGENIIL